MAREIPEPPELHVTALRSGGVTNVAVAGEMDIASVGDFGAAVREHLASGPVLLDLRKLTFMDSSGVRALDALMRDVEREGWSLTIRSDMHGNVRQVLRLTGMLDALPLQDPAGTP
ncbi:MAG: STAS domain-containing protein [Solirubrobacterales bacterium]|nr:STAS domain-containing protein [Solirubrobacterales bacterium]